jgi:type VI protein secretion system component Hcp
MLYPTDLRTAGKLRDDKMKKAITRRNIPVVVVFLLAAIVIALVPTAASAQNLTFMHVPGIPGASTYKGYEDWITVASLRQAWDAAGNKNRNSCEIDVVKGLDISGPNLWAAAVTGQLFAEIIIDVTNFSTDGPRRIYQIRLSHAHITSIVTAVNTTLAETVTVAAAGLTLTVYTQNAAGAPGPPVTTTFACN